MQSGGRNKIKPITKAACYFSGVHAVGLLMTGKQMVILRAPHILASCRFKELLHHGRGRCKFVRI